MTSEKKSNELILLDAVVVGAGFSGLYMLHRLRDAGFSTSVYEAASGVGGTWYWNRYPGARCDSESIYYNYTFSEELYKEWSWSSKYPEQPEILKYLNFVADKLDLRRDINFNTRVTSAIYDEEQNRWLIKLNDNTQVLAKYFITGVGCLSAANIPNFTGLDNFKGDWFHTGHWPHEKVNFQGKRVGIIGTGSSGVQSIPVIAKEAEHLTVFQRTPQLSVPANNHAYDPEFIQSTKEKYGEIKQKARDSMRGISEEPRDISAMDDTPEERQRIYEEAWEQGGIWALGVTYNDLLINEEANKTVTQFIRSKIHKVIENPEVADKLMGNHYFGTKRPISDTYYYETYNRNNVSLVDLKSTPIKEITTNGLRTSEEDYELDILVFATGYDGVTGPLLKMDIRGRNGVTLKDKWDDGAQTRTYLGIATAGFPNMFMLTGPESPSVLSNMPVSIEQHVEWTADCITYLREHNIDTIEASVEAENAWSKHCQDIAETTLFTKTESWYTGANIDDKPRGFPLYAGGVGPYREKCTEVANDGYVGFNLKSALKTAKH